MNASKLSFGARGAVERIRPMMLLPSLVAFPAILLRGILAERIGRFMVGGA